MADANATTTTTLASTRQTYVDAAIGREIRANLIFAGVIQWNSGFIGAAWTRARWVATIPTLSSVSAGNTETDAITTSPLTTAGVTATPAMKAAFVLASLISLRTTQNANMPQEIMDLLARSAADLIDVDIATLFSGFSVTVGQTGVPLALATMAQAVTLFQRNAKSAASMGAFFISPQQHGDLALEQTTGTGAGAAIVMNQMAFANLFAQGGGEIGREINLSYRGHFQGYAIVVSPNVQEINTNVDDCGALMKIGPESAIFGAMSWAPETAEHDNRVVHKPAKSYSVDTAYAVAEYRDEYGVGIVSKTGA